MLVAIDGISARVGGGVSYLRSQIAALSEAAADWRFLIYCGFDTANVYRQLEAPNVRVIPVRLTATLGMRLAWEQLVLPLSLLSRQVDVLYCPGNHAVLFARPPQVLLIQSINVSRPAREEHRLGRRLKRIVQKRVTLTSLRRAAATVFVSKECRRAVLGETGASPQGANSDHVIHSAVDPLFFAARRSGGEWLGPSRYVLSVSDLYPHKNLEGLLKGFALAQSRMAHPIRLLIAGRVVDGRYHRRLKRLTSDLGIADHVQFLGAVPWGELPALYREAACYVSTSLREAFPLTPLEAMASATPVLVSDLPVFREICGSAALYCAAKDPDDIANKLSSLLEDPKVREDQVDLGLDHAKRRTWGANAQELVGVIESVTKGSQKRRRGATVHPRR